MLEQPPGRTGHRSADNRPTSVAYVYTSKAPWSAMNERVRIKCIVMIVVMRKRSWHINIEKLYFNLLRIRIQRESSFCIGAKEHLLLTFCGCCFFNTYNLKSQLQNTGL